MTKKKGIREYLKERANVTDEQIAKIESKFVFRKYKRGDLLMNKGDVCRIFFFVEKGLLRLYSIDAAGKEHVLQFAPEGGITGDRACVYLGEPSEFYIDALEDCEVVLMDDASLSYMAEVSPQFREHNKLLLHNHIRSMQNRINSLISASAEERYLDFLKKYPQLMLRVAQWMVASYLGITPESLSRVKKELVKNNKNL